MITKPKVKGYRGRFNNNKRVGNFGSAYSVTDIIKCYILLIVAVVILILGLDFIIS